MDWDIVENYYYWDMHPNKTYLKNKIGLYKYLIKLKMYTFKKSIVKNFCDHSIYNYYKNKFIDPMQEKCNELIKENFYLKKELEYYKSKHTFKKSSDIANKIDNVHIKIKNKKID